VISQWQKRYYYIQKSSDTYSLLYKDDEKDTVTKGEIDIEKILSITYQTNERDFKIIYPDKTIELYAKTPPECHQWVTNLNIIRKEIENIDILRYERR
jgi:hypothetical protein